MNEQCKNIQPFLIDYLDKNLSDSLKIEVKSHLENCKYCQDELIQTGQLIQKIEKSEFKAPSSNLRSNFYAMLEKEKNKSIDKKPEPKTVQLNLLKYAAQIIILIGFGFLIGTQVSNKSDNTREILALRNEIHTLENNLSMSSLSHATASQRLNAINTIKSKNSVDDSILKVLINTLNSDENINVRMASAYALSKYSENEQVKEALIYSLENQKDPLLQITLIGILVELQDERAKSSIEKLLKDKEAPSYVKEQAKEGLKVFI